MFINIINQITYFILISHNIKIYYNDNYLYSENIQYLLFPYILSYNNE